MESASEFPDEGSAGLRLVSASHLGKGFLSILGGQMSILLVGLLIGRYVLSEIELNGRTHISSGRFDQDWRLHGRSTLRSQRNPIRGLETG